MSDTQGLKPGTILRHDTYRIERMLGQGGFGITYLATHVRLKKKVAIKEFFPKAFCDRDADTSHVRTASNANSITVEKLKNKFIKEAEHIAEMDSQFIVKISDVFEENHTAYYIMDYIEGSSLSDIVKKNGPLPEKQAVEYISKIGEALTYIHSMRMNHLDVKPANIMIRAKDDIPILIDFGLSKQYDSEGNQTSTTPVGISHGYAPIEQYRDGGVKEFSPQTDLYSLAATLYYILSGVTPPQATTLIEDDLTFPSSFPLKLEEPVRKAMSSVRKRRQESIYEFIKDLNSTIDDVEYINALNNNNQNLEDTIVNSSIFSDRQSHVSEQLLNTDDDSDSSQNYYSEDDEDNEDDEDIPFYKKKWFLIGGAAVFTIIFLIALYQFGYLSIFNSSWQPSYNTSDDLSAIEDQPQSDDMLMDSATAELTPVITTTVSDKDDNIKSTKDADKKTALNETTPADESKSNAGRNESRTHQNNTSANDEIFADIEEPAQFPGGLTALSKWLGANIHYPIDAQENNVQGKVVVKFVIEKDGSISNVGIARGIDYSLDKEAMRVVKCMPKWKPAKKDGKPVRSYYTIPVRFSLTN